MIAAVIYGLKQDTPNYASGEISPPLGDCVIMRIFVNLSF
jgi:hypothetical protein